MKYHPLRTALILLTTTTVSFAEVDDILANLGSFKPKITVSDTYSEGILTEVDEGDVYRSVEANPQRIAISVTANLDGAGVGPIDAETTVRITAGYFDHAGILGGADQYEPGKSRAIFRLTKEMERANGDVYEVSVGSVVYAWTATKLTVTVLCTDIEGASVNDVAAIDYIGLADAGTSVMFAGDTTDVSVSFGEATGTRRIFLEGKSTTMTKKFGSVAAGTDEEFDLVNVNLKGEADIAGPVVKATFAPKPNSNRTIDVAGSAADDRTSATLDSITVNGIETDPAATGSEDGPNGSWMWSLTGLPLVKGKNVVALSFSDEEGNVTTVTKTYVPDGKGPVVKAFFPLKPSANNTINIIGTADDASLVSLDSITVNGVAATPAELSAGDTGVVVWNWSVGGVQLARGRNVVLLTFSDEDGNITKATKTYTIR